MAFTNYIQQITATNGTTHDLVDTSASHYVKGTQTSSTNAWTGALPDGVTAYYDGLSIDYFLPYTSTSSGATLNLGGKGAKPIYYGNGTGAVTTHYPQYSVIHLTYIVNSNLNSGNGCWKADAYCNDAAKHVATTDSSWHKILGTYTSNTSIVGSVNSTTGPVDYKNNDGPAYQPSTGIVYAPQLYVSLATNEALYTNLQNLGWTDSIKTIS